MKGFLTKSKTSQPFPDISFLEDMIKRQLVEKNPKLLENKALLEETIRRALKEHNLIPKPSSFTPPPIPLNVQTPQVLANNKPEVATIDLLDIGFEKNEGKAPEIPEISNEKPEKPQGFAVEETKKSEDLFEKVEVVAPVKVEKLDKKIVNEEVKAKYQSMVQPCKFKFETNDELAKFLQQKLIDSVEKDEITVDKAFVIKVLENLEYLRKCQLENRELEEKYQSTISDYGRMQERLINQENLLKTIEFTYQEKINNAEYSHQEKINEFLIENKSLKHVIEKQERMLSLQAETSKEELSQVQETLKKLQNVRFFIIFVIFPA